MGNLVEQSGSADFGDRPSRTKYNPAYCELHQVLLSYAGCSPPMNMPLELARPFTKAPMMIRTLPVQTAIRLPNLYAIQSPTKAVTMEGKKIEADIKPRSFPFGAPKYLSHQLSFLLGRKDSRGP